jgi:hypothetical protein
MGKKTRGEEISGEEGRRGRERGKWLVFNDNN